VLKAVTWTWKELLFMFSIYLGLSHCRILSLFAVFFLRPLPYEALTQLIDEASEGDMSISILTQVKALYSPIWQFTKTTK
jgi:hypothetical protein